MVGLVRRLTLSPRSRRSANPPISVLPPELLVQIFRFYALGVLPWSCVLRYRGIQKQGWIGITHVCQRWRQVALGDSSLWARITGFSPNSKWIPEMLVRARNAPLVVDFAYTPVPEILSKFAPHISRIRELRLRGLSLHRPRSLREICALEAPVLEHFELEVVTPYPATFRQLGVTMLFGGWTPKLRTLTLSKVAIPWSLIPCGQLTQLKMTLYRGISVHGTALLSDSSQLLDLLINSPDLEVLVLEFCFPTVLQAADGQTARLPRLSRLCLGGSTSCVASLLKVLQLPSSTTLHLQCIPENLSTYNVNIILPLVSAHFHNPTPLEFRSLRIVINNGLNGPIDVAVSTARPKSATSVLHALEDDIGSDAELTISFDRLPSSGYPTQEDILEDVFSMLPISKITLFSISIPASIPSVDWFELSQRCEKVTTIRASGRGTSGLLRSLSARIPGNTTSSSKGKKVRYVNRATGVQRVIKNTGAHARTTPFPKLTSLLLENVDFGHAISRRRVLYDFFTLALTERKWTHKRLSVLGVDRCVITPDRAKGLERCVQELRWDGDEGLSFKEWDGDSDFTKLDVDFPPGTTQADWPWFGKPPI